MPYLIENFLSRRAVTALHGRPQAYQSFLAEEVAFSAASGFPLFGDSGFYVRRYVDDYRHVVFLVDSATDAQAIISKAASWCHTRGMPGEELGITPIDITPLVSERSFSGAFFEELEKREINPVLIVSSLAATDTLGFAGSYAQLELALAKAAVAKLGCAVFIAGNTGPFDNPPLVEQIAGMTDALWKVAADMGHVLTLTHGHEIIKLAGRIIGGDGRLPTLTFDIAKEETVS